MNYLVIPAYEPDGRLLTLLSEMLEWPEFTIVVVNDGSPEDYGPIFGYAHNYGIVLEHENNRGKGEALKTAFSYIIEADKKGGGVVVTADADGQHKAEDILAVAEASAAHPYELVIGSRRLDGRIPLKSKLGNAITRHVFRLSTGTSVYDTQSGLRGFSAAFLPFMCSVKGARYEYEMNMLVEACSCIDILEVPIETIYLNQNKASHFRPFRDALLIYKDLLKFMTASVVGFVTDYSMYMLLVALLSQAPVESRLAVSNILARVLSATVNYTMNKNYVFKDRQRVWRTGTEYFLLAGCILLLDTWLVAALGAAGVWNPYLVKIPVDCALFILSWIVQQRIIFRKRGKVRL